MSIYILNIIIILFISIIMILKIDKNMKDILVLISGLFPLTITSMIRAYNVGVDTNSYIIHYERIKNIQFKDISKYDMEILYVLLNKVITLLGDNKQLIIICTTLIIMALLYKFIKNNSNNVWMSVFLFLCLDFYFVSFNLIRQFIAIMIVANSFKYIKQEKIFKFIFCIFIATLFHSSALVCVPIYFFKDIEINFKNISLFSIISGCLFFMNDLLIKILIKIFPSYYHYLNSSYFNGNTGSGVRGIIVYGGILTFVTLILIKFREKRKDINCMYYCLFIAFVIAILGKNFLLISRIMYYFAIFVIIIIPNCLCYIKQKKIKIFIHYSIIILGVLSNLYSIITGFHGIVPYSVFYK